MSKKFKISSFRGGIEGRKSHILNVSKYLTKNKIDHIRLHTGGCLAPKKIEKLVLFNKST